MAHAAPQEEAKASSGTSVLHSLSPQPSIGHETPGSLAWFENSPSTFHFLDSENCSSPPVGPPLPQNCSPISLSPDVARLGQGPPRFDSPFFAFLSAQQSLT